MTNWIDENLLQTAVYWSDPLSDGYGGFSFNSPVEILCRWEDRNELFINKAAQEVQSSAVVFLTQDVDIGGWLYLGNLTDIASGLEDAPQLVAGAKEIRGFKKIPDIDGTLFERIAWL